MFIRVLLTSQVVFARLSNLDASIQQLPGVAAYCERPVASTAKKTLENLVFFFWLPAEWTNGEWKRIYRLYSIRMMILGSILRKDEASFYNYRKLYYVVFSSCFYFQLYSCTYIYIYVVYVYLDITRHCQFNLPWSDPTHHTINIKLYQYWLRNNFPWMLKKVVLCHHLTLDYKNMCLYICICMLLSLRIKSQRSADFSPWLN